MIIIQLPIWIGVTKSILQMKAMAMPNFGVLLDFIHPFLIKVYFIILNLFSIKECLNVTLQI